MRILTNQFCVYTHDVDGVIFYVGKGKNNRPLETINRNDLWKNHVEENNNEFNVDIVNWFKIEKDAFSYEKKLIYKHRPKCNIQMNSLLSKVYKKSLLVNKYPNNLLAKHIDETYLSIADYSEAVGVSHDTIRRALDGDFTEKTAKRIFDYSKGKVQLQPQPIKYD